MARRRERLRNLAFVLRCSGAATVSYALAQAAGLPYPIWASIAGIVVSQEKLNDTNSAALWQLTGTVTGILLAMLVGGLLSAARADVTVQLAAAVGLCAVVVRRWPSLKMSMTTVPIIYLLHTPDMPVLEIGFWRCAEVLLGGAVGAALHGMSELAIGRLEARLG